MTTFKKNQKVILYCVHNSRHVYQGKVAYITAIDKSEYGISYKVEIVGVQRPISMSARYMIPWKFLTAKEKILIDILRTRAISHRTIHELLARTYYNWEMFKA